MYSLAEKEQNKAPAIRSPGNVSVDFLPPLADIAYFLRGMLHFQYLPAEEIERMASHIGVIDYNKGEHLAVQNLTELGHIYIVRSGRIAVFHENETESYQVGHILAGEVFGGISLLMNDGMSLRTAIAEEDTTVYLLSSKYFFSLCDEYPFFSSFFAEKVMDAPLVTIDEEAMVFEALLKMIRHGINHLAVTNGQQEIVGMLSNRDLLEAQGQSPMIVLNDISQAKSIEMIACQYQRLPKTVQTLINSGASAKNISSIITTVSDNILKQTMELTLADMDKPPVNFAFIVLGSEGRGEQTLKTDQDNAIIFDDVSKADLASVNGYFMELGRRVCERLNQIGYSYCQGEVMAQNPNWCQPLSGWMKYFLNWVHASEPEDLLHSSIFFDFRFAYGDNSLVEALRNHLFGVLRQWNGFLRFMVENALYYKPPLGFFRNFVVESKGEHKHQLDLKWAMTPIVDFARIYALQNTIPATNTLERLRLLRDKNVLSPKQFEELEKSYSFLMQLRIVRQLTALLEEDKPPDNFINPKRLTRIEQTMLKEIFKRIRNYQVKMSFDYTGVA